ncbi:unnamed protein product, partial [Mesorhabditis belari]|uniref:Acyltransferase n=1 Tax=Mesorhabditis belari TaxID=2138241 RepID=A0AAF3FC69_9BILA
MAVQQYYNMVVDSLEIDDKLKETFTGVARQSLFAGAGTAVGGAIGGKNGAFLGALLGGVIGYFTTPDYSGLVTYYKNLPEARKAEIVEKVQSLVGSISVEDYKIWFGLIENKEMMLNMLLQKPSSVLGIEFAPLNIPLQRRLQTIAVLHHFFLTLAIVIMMLVLPIYLLFTSFWWLIFVYATWLYFDWESPQRGAYPLKWFRDMRVHKYFADYFPVRLHKTAELDGSTNYLVGSHPHGIISLAALVNFTSNATGVDKLFPNVFFRLCTLEGQFWTPFRREYAMLHGFIGCSKKSINWVLENEKKGLAAVLVIGGAEEALDAHPGHHTLTLSNRKGFIRLAIESGASLVPCYAFGENDIYTQIENPKGSKLREFQTWAKQKLGISPPIFRGRGVFNYTFGLLPFRKPIDYVVGNPIKVEKNKNPSREEVDKVHARYVKELVELFEAHKTKYGCDETTKLVIQ